MKYYQTKSLLKKALSLLVLLAFTPVISFAERAPLPKENLGATPSKTELPKELSPIYDYFKNIKDCDVSMSYNPASVDILKNTESAPVKVSFTAEKEFLKSTIYADFNKFPNCKESLEDIEKTLKKIQPKADNLNYRFETKTNRFLAEISFKKDTSPMEVIDTSLGELNKTFCFLDFVEKNNDISEAFDFTQNIIMTPKFPLFFLRVNQYPHKELGYSFRYEDNMQGSNSTIFVDEYCYSHGRTWENDIQNESLKKHFNKLVNDVKALHPKTVQKTPIKIEKFANHEYYTQSFELIRNGYKTYSTIYLTVIRGKLIKFRASYYLLNDAAEEKVKKLIKIRTADRLAL